MDAIAELIEDDVVPRHDGPHVALQVEAMAVASVGSLPAVVVENAAGDFHVLVDRFSVERDATVVDHQVDVLGIGRVVRYHGGTARIPENAGASGGGRVGDLEAPEHGVLAADGQDADRRPGTVAV